MTSLHFMFALNGNNGEPTGVCGAIDLIVQDGFESALELRNEMDLEEFDAGSPRCQVEAGKISIHGQEFKYRGRKRHVGNMAWDSIELPVEEGVRLLNHLRSNQWDCDSGYSELFEAWNAGVEFTADLLEKGMGN